MNNNFLNNTTVSGTVIKFSVILVLPGHTVMDDVDFSIIFFIHTDKPKVFLKSQMARVSENNYTVEVDTTGMGAGTISYQVEVILPGGRKEIIKGSTGEKIEHGVC